MKGIKARRYRPEEGDQLPGSNDKGDVREHPPIRTLNESVVVGQQVEKPFPDFDPEPTTYEESLRRLREKMTPEQLRKEQENMSRSITDQDFEGGPGHRER